MRKTPIRSSIAAIALFCTAMLFGVGCGTDENEGASGKGNDKPVFRFSAIPSEKDATGYTAKFKVVADYLTKTLGVTFEYHHANLYSASVRAFEQGEVLLAWFGGLTGVQARHRVPGAQAIVQGVEDPNFYSYFVAHKSTGLTRADEFPMGMKGLTFTFGDPHSTSGRLMPEHFIRTKGGDAPESFFKSVAFSGGHNTTATQVASGQVQCGAMNYKTYDSMVASGEIDPDVCRVIWKTTPYADYNFTAHPDIDTIYGAGFTDRLQQALIDMKGEDLLEKPFGRSGMIKATNEDFAAILQEANNLKFLGDS